MSKPTDIKSTPPPPILRGRVSQTWWQRIIWPRTFGILCARMSPDAKVTVFTGDLSVRIQNQHFCITSAYSGTISGTTKRGTEWSVPTGPLYIEAAEASGIAVTYRPGKGYEGTYGEVIHLD